MNISPEYYSLIYYIFLLIVIIIVYVDSQTDILHCLKKQQKYFQLFCVIFLIFFIGLRPVGEGGYYDSQMYIRQFEYAREFHKMKIYKDPGFDYLVFITSYFFNYKLFFLFCSFLSIILLFFTSKLINKEKWFLFFLATCCSLYYLDYQVFTIRQGIACALFLLAMVTNNRYLKIVILIISILFHKSLLLPVIAFLIVYIFYSKVLFYFLIWLCSIPVSLFSGHWWETFFARFLGNDIRTIYFTDFFNNSKEFFRTGFRWDFILYSFLFIIIGLYNLKFVSKNDKNYRLFFNTYLIVNSITILIIRANNIHRFAYLSWFLIPLIVFYPFILNYQKENHKKIILTLCMYFSMLITYKIFQ